MYWNYDNVIMSFFMEWMGMGIMIVVMCIIWGTSSGIYIYIYICSEKTIIWSPADFVSLPTDKEIINL